eukprot:178030-Chlamydomonas_euryale.AAC.21
MISSPKAGPRAVRSGFTSGGGGGGGGGSACGSPKAVPPAHMQQQQQQQQAQRSPHAARALFAAVGDGGRHGLASARPARTAVAPAAAVGRGSGGSSG